MTIDKIINENGENILYSRQRTLSWSSGEAQDENYSGRVNHQLDLTPKVLRVADIAEAQLGRIMLTTWRGEQYLPVGIYEMHIAAHGMWKGNDINKSDVFVVEYKGGNNVLVRQKVKNEAKKQKTPSEKSVPRAKNS